jgi:hypothetical protein
MSDKKRVILDFEPKAYEILAGAVAGSKRAGIATP